MIVIARSFSGSTMRTPARDQAHLDLMLRNARNQAAISHVSVFDADGSIVSRHIRRAPESPLVECHRP